MKYIGFRFDVIAEEVTFLIVTEGKDAFIISPGVGFQGGEAKDTLNYANAAIIGRSIYNSESPQESLEQIIKSIS